MAQFSLKWNSHVSNMLTAMENLKFIESLVDVTLTCEGRTLKAHKLVLCTGSKYFHQLFLANPCQHPIIILHDVKYVTLKLIIDFLYKGEISVSINEIEALLKTAQTLDIKGLTEVCKQQLSSQNLNASGTVHSQKTISSTTPLVSTPAAALMESLSIPASLDSATAILQKETQRVSISSQSSHQKRKRRRSSESEVIVNKSLPKMEEPSSMSPPPVEFLPLIADTRTLAVDESSLESLLVDEDSMDQAVASRSHKKDASTEYEMPLRTLENNENGQGDRSVSCQTSKSKSLKYFVESLPGPTKSTGKIRKRAEIWKFFTIVNDAYARCKICGNQLSYKTSVTNLTKHIRKKHSTVNLNRPKLFLASTEVDTEESFDDPEAEMIDELLQENTVASKSSSPFIHSFYSVK